MNVLKKTIKSVRKLETMGSKIENIKIIASPIFKDFFIEEFKHLEITIDEIKCIRNIHGAEITFNHFDNEIVIYDKELAYMYPELKIVLALKSK